jgi:hypothetical protein
MNSIAKARRPGLPLVWQWNHNPDNALWSLTARPGFLRLTTGRVDGFPLRPKHAHATNDRPGIFRRHRGGRQQLKDGDFAGLALLQRDYGLVGVKAEGGTNFIVMVNARKIRPRKWSACR